MDNSIPVHLYLCSKKISVHNNIIMTFSDPTENEIKVTLLDISQTHCTMKSVMSTLIIPYCPRRECNCGK